MKPNVSFLSVRVNKSITCQSRYAVHVYSHGGININVNWVCRPLMSAVTGQTQPGLVELETECYLVSHSVDCQRWRGTSRDDAVHSQVIRLQAVWSRCLQENKKDMFSQPGWRWWAIWSDFDFHSKAFDMTLVQEILKHRQQTFINNKRATPFI